MPQSRSKIRSLEIIGHQCLALIAGLAVTGCVPMRHVYYLPSGPGSAVSSRCLSAKARIEIPLGSEILLALSAVPEDTSAYPEYSRTPGTGAKIYLTLSIPEGQSVQMSSNRLTVLGEHFEKQVFLEQFELVRGGRKFAATDELKGDSYEPPSWSVWRDKDKAMYLGKLIPVGSEPASFRVVLPSLTVSGAKVDVPPISFQRRDEYVVNSMCP